MFAGRAAVKTPHLGLLSAVTMAVTACATDRSSPDEPAAAASRSGHDISLPSEMRTLVARVTRGATLSSLLRTHAVAERDVAALVAQITSVFDVRALRHNRPYRLVQAIDGALRRFEYEIDADRVLTVTRNDRDAFVAAVDAITKRTETAVVAGAIDRQAPALFAAMSRARERVDLSLALANILGSEVDFNTDVQPGDRFGLVIEKQFRAEPDDRALPSVALPDEEEGDGFTGYGPIAAAELVNAGRTISAIRFTPVGSAPQYFDEHGRSLKRFFLKSPLKFDPIVTSHFSKRRLHPVLGVPRPHLGIDYRAPTGAPVVAVGDGRVVSAGYSRGAGQMVHLRHANGLETQYLHLSAATVRPGDRVQQGDVIGRVGATGLATGPHLDYRVRKDGQFVNPMAVHQAMPPGEPVPLTDRPAFEATRNRALAALGAAN
ncbi:MAG: M23 family metallopeptidase [Acidimicrobiia bacterium]|nr:M23 family metallopeptidase [Acidimicrobiia bacterium]